MSTFPEENFKDDDSYTYLLTAGFDQTVRLHACQPNTSNEEKGMYVSLCHNAIYPWILKAIFCDLYEWYELIFCSY